MVRAARRGIAVRLMPEAVRIEVRQNGEQFWMFTGSLSWSLFFVAFFSIKRFHCIQSQHCTSSMDLANVEIGFLLSARVGGN